MEQTDMKRKATQLKKNREVMPRVRKGFRRSLNRNVCDISFVRENILGSHLERSAYMLNDYILKQSTEYQYFTDPTKVKLDTSVSTAKDRMINECFFLQAQKRASLIPDVLLLYILRDIWYHSYNYYDVSTIPEIDTIESYINFLQRKINTQYEAPLFWHNCKRPVFFDKNTITADLDRLSLLMKATAYEKVGDFLAEKVNDLLYSRSYIVRFHSDTWT